MSEKPVLLEIRDRVAWVTLNRPQQLNALSVAMIKGLDEAVEAIAADRDCRAVVLTGAGPAFCAGGDLKEFRQLLEDGKPDELETFVREISALFARLEALPIPIIAALNGTTVAGGLELTLCCDIVLAAEGARIGDGHVRFGVLPGGGAAARLPRKIPINKAAELFLSGELKSAEWWERAGLVSRVVPLEKLEMEAKKLAETIASYSQLAGSDMKIMVRRTPDMSLAEGLAFELEIFSVHARREDLIEGLRAFSEKRPPHYRGR
ncbi:MAG: enoyl-CoA hydratase [Rhizobiales bacterium PAR1]|nr:MAG: enoyl-CoA hydratase [Rhizobiales bacterium PAR1]